MEFVAFVLCMAIIAQINAAPTPQSESSVPHKDNEFELPPISRGGFQMILDVTIDGKYDDTVKGKSLKVIMLPNENEKSEIQSKFCPYNGDGMHICILPFDETLLNRAGESQTTSIKVQVTALRNADDLHLEVDVEENNVGDGTIPLKEFEKLKHFSVGGIAGNIQRLNFDFTDQR